MKCENDDCKNQVDPEYEGHLCAGYIDLSEGRRWCNCCNICRQECLSGAIDEKIEKGEML